MELKFNEWMKRKSLASLVEDMGAEKFVAAVKRGDYDLNVYHDEDIMESLRSMFPDFRFHAIAYRAKDGPYMLVLHLESAWDGILGAIGYEWRKVFHSKIKPKQLNLHTIDKMWHGMKDSVKRRISKRTGVPLNTQDDAANHAAQIVGAPLERAIPSSFSEKTWANVVKYVLQQHKKPDEDGFHIHIDQREENPTCSVICSYLDIIKMHGKDLMDVCYRKMTKWLEPAFTMSPERLEDFMVFDRDKFVKDVESRF